MVDGEKVYGAPEWDVESSTRAHRERVESGDFVVYPPLSTCFICDPENPDADPEGCAECDRKEQINAGKVSIVPRGFFVEPTAAEDVVARLETFVHAVVQDIHGDDPAAHQIGCLDCASEVCAASVLDLDEWLDEMVRIGWEDPRG